MQALWIKLLLGVRRVGLFSFCFSFSLLSRYVMYVWVDVLLSCIFMQHTCAWYLQRPQEGLGFPGTEVTDYCELS